MFLSLFICLSLISDTVLSYTCEDAHSCVGFRIYDEALCYGFQSCLETKMDVTSGVECSGGQSCYEARGIQAVGLIICSGYQSCLKSRFLTSSNSSIMCTGQNACAQQDITAINGEVVCSGATSCKSTNVDTKRIGCM